MVKNFRIDAFVKSLVFEADLGNVDPLCQFLMSDEPLTAEDRERLAWLIMRRVPQGATNAHPSAKKAALTCATYLVWQGKMVLREHSLAEAKMIARDALIRAAISMSEKEFGLSAGSVSQEEVAKAQRHGGSRTVVDYVRDYMPDATARIRRLAMTMCRPSATIERLPVCTGALTSQARVDCHQ
jgi:hypothetical protein